MKNLSRRDRSANLIFENKIGDTREGSRLQLRFLGLLLFLILNFPFAGTAQFSFQQNGVSYTCNLTTHSATVTSYSGGSGSISIPSSINFTNSVVTNAIPLKVVKIEPQAFADSRISGISIPSTVTEIGDYAFNQCSNLKQAQLGNGIKVLGAETFSYCTSLMTVTGGGRLSNIGEGAFAFCESLTRFDIPNSVTRIEDSTFAFCDHLEEITIGSGIAYIGNYAFMGCTNIAKLTININIADGEFSGWQSLKSVIIGDGVTSIGYKGFAVCTNLNTIIIPNSVTTIKDQAFSECTGLTTITIGNGVSSIGKSAFYNCKSLRSLIIPDNVNSIGSFAFGYCSKLQNVNIGTGLSTITNNTFFGCSNLAKVSLPISATNIGASAFYSCANLKSITIPSGIGAIGSMAFAYCISLTNICFEGNAPTDGGALFVSAPLKSVKYVPGTTGWGLKFSGITTVPCSECDGAAYATILPLRVTTNQANFDPKDDLDLPIIPNSDIGLLDSGQAPLGDGGVVADDVTPVLFMISGTPGPYSIQLTVLGGAYKPGSVMSKLRVLTPSFGWAASTNIVIGATGTAYAFLEGLSWSDFENLSPLSPEVHAIVKLNSSDGLSEIATTQFGVRPPPVILVHGVADNGRTWSDDFTNELKTIVPEDFILTLSYGQPVPGTIEAQWNQWWPCTIAPFQLLALDLDKQLEKIETRLKSKWAFTRYDAVGHSQGGVLLRMLCQIDSKSGAPAFTSTAVVSQANMCRGRFRRVITIGSPHNGSDIMYYIEHMRLSPFPSDLLKYNLANFAAPAVHKFNPDGDEIKKINNVRLPVDSRINFHCIKAVINDGNPPVADASRNPPIYNLLGLQHRLLTGRYAGLTRGQVLFASGSDGVVDSSSQGGGITTHNSQIPGNIAHAIGGEMFSVGEDETETHSASVGSRVAALLNGPKTNAV